MASVAQAYFVTDLAVQTGVLPIEKFDDGQADVLTWTNREVTAAINFLKSRLWRSRTPATKKQVEYGTRLNLELAEETGSEPDDIDFAAMNSLEATEVITRLEALRDLFAVLDAATESRARTPRSRRRRTTCTRCSD